MDVFGVSAFLQHRGNNMIVSLVVICCRSQQKEKYCSVLECDGNDRYVTVWQ